MNAHGQAFHAPRLSHQRRRQQHAGLAASLLAQRRQEAFDGAESAAAPATLTFELPPEPTVTTLLRLATSSGSPVTAAAAASVDRLAGDEQSSTASAAILRPSMLPAVTPTQDGTTTSLLSLASGSSLTTTMSPSSSSHTEDSTHTESHATHINAGTIKAMQALMLGFSLLFLAYALYQLPWTVARMSRGGWRSGWALRISRPRSSASSSKAQRVSPPKLVSNDEDDDAASVEDRTDLVPVGLSEKHYNEGWSAPSLVRASTPLARFPRPSFLLHYTWRVPGLNVTLKQIACFAPFALIVTLTSVVQSHYLWDATRTGK